MAPIAYCAHKCAYYKCYHANKVSAANTNTNIRYDNQVNNVQWVQLHSNRRAVYLVFERTFADCHVPRCVRGPSRRLDPIRHSRGSGVQFSSSTS